MTVVGGSRGDRPTRRAGDVDGSIGRVRLAFIISQVFYGLATSLFDMYYTLYLQQVGISAAGAGEVFSVGFAVMAIVVLPLSAVADRIGSEVTMLLSSFGFGMTMLVIPNVTSLGAQIVLFGLNSVCSAVMLVSVNAVVGSVVRDERRRLATYRTGFVAFLGSSAVGNVIGVAVAHFGTVSVGSYRFALLLSGGLAVVIGVARIAMWRHGGGQLSARGQGLITAGRTLVGNARGFALLLVLSGLVGGAGVLAIRFISLIAVDYLKVAPQYLGWLLAADRLASMLGIFVLFPLMKRAGVFRVAGFGMIVALIFQILSATAPTTLLYITYYLSRQGVHYAQMPVLDHLANLDAPVAARALSNGVERMGIFVGSALASLVYGVLLAGNRYPAAIVLSGVLAGLAGVLYLVRAQLDTHN
jgi:MFS family permease